MSTAGFMARWAAWQGGLSALTWGPSYAVMFWLFSFNILGCFSAVLAGVSGLLVGMAGSRLLAQHRRKVRRWTLAVLIASVAAALLGQSALNRLWQELGSLWPVGKAPDWLGWGFGVVYGVTQALFLSVAQGLALWGRRWPKTALIWVPGQVAVGLLAGAAGTAFQLLQPAGATSSSGGFDPVFGLRMAGLGLCMGAIEGAGTAWLLDRCEFRRAEPEGP